MKYMLVVFIRTTGEMQNHFFETKEQMDDFAKEVKKRGDIIAHKLEIEEVK